MCIPVFIGALDLTVVSAVLPQVIYDLQLPLQSSLSEASWVVNGYLLVYTVAIAFMGRLSDFHGRRRIYLLSLLVFAAGSLLVAVADGEPRRLLSLLARWATGERPDPALMGLRALIAARMIQAFGGGAMVPVSMALVGDLFPAGRRAMPLGVIGAVDTLGWVFGHLYGGILVRFFDWRIIFWINLPVCLLAFALIFLVLRSLPQSRAAGMFDWPGAILISGALIGLTVGLGVNSSESGAQSAAMNAPQAVPGLLLLAAFLVCLFLLWESRQPVPLLPLPLFRNRSFSSACLANFLVGFCLIIAIANVPLFINGLIATTLQQGAWDSGWMLAGLTVPMAAAAFAGGSLCSRIGYRGTAWLGFAGCIAGLGMMSLWTPDTGYLAMATQMAIAGVGFGLVISPIAAAVVDAAGAAERGTASGMVILLRLCGMTVGGAMMTTYGLQRSESLLRTMTVDAADMAASVQAGLHVLNQVISETFLVALGVCVAAMVPVFFLSTKHQEPSVSDTAI